MRLLGKHSFQLNDDGSQLLMVGETDSELMKLMFTMRVMVGRQEGCGLDSSSYQVLYSTQEKEPSQPSQPDTPPLAT